MPTRNAVAQSRLAVGVANAHSSRGVPTTFKAALLDFVERAGGRGDRPLLQARCKAAR
jgi:hypothetical protein